MKLIHFIKKNIKSNWNWYTISKCKGITWEDIKENIDLPWNSQGVMENPNISYEIFKQDSTDENLHNYIISYESLSENLYLDFAFVEKHIDKNWNWDMLSKNKNITIYFIKKYLHKINICKLIKNTVFNFDILKLILEKKVYKSEYDFCKIAKNPNFTLSWLTLLREFNIETINLNLVVKHKNVSWIDIMSSENLKCQSDICYNPNITFEIIEENPQIKWDFTWLSSNKNITWENIIETLDKYDWSVKVATCNPNITWSIIKQYPKLNWDWCHICLTFKIDEEDIDTYPIDFTYFSSNPYITMDLVKKYKHKPWNYNEVIKTIF